MKKLLLLILLVGSLSSCKNENNRISEIEKNFKQDNLITTQIIETDQKDTYIVYVYTYYGNMVYESKYLAVVENGKIVYKEIYE